MLPQAAERTSEDIPGWIRVAIREEDISAVIQPLAGFALDLGVFDQVLRAATTDASGPVRPALAITLAESKLGTLAFPVLGLRRLSGKKPVQPRKIEPVRDILRMANDELEFVEFAHVVLDSQ